MTAGGKVRNRTADRYRANLDAIKAALLAFALTTPADADLQAMLDTLAQADAIGPFLDPTKYHARLSDGSLSRQRDMVRLALRTRRVLREIAPELAPIMDQQEGQDAYE